MRQIKFRGKRIDKDEWKYGVPVYNGNRCFLISCAADWDEEFFQPEDWWQVDPETVGQFTGLHDKNEKEIYEGDVLSVDIKENETCGRLHLEEKEITVRGVVEYNSNSCSYQVKMDKNELSIVSVEFGWAGEEFEIIGTIHDNPELI